MTKREAVAFFERELAAVPRNRWHLVAARVVAVTVSSGFLGREDEDDVLAALLLDGKAMGMERQ